MPSILPEVKLNPQKSKNNYRFNSMEDAVYIKRKKRAKVDRDAEKFDLSDWIKIDSKDVFSLPTLEGGFSEYIIFNNRIIPLNSTEHIILDSFWSEEVELQIIQDLNSSGDFEYDNHTKEWVLNLDKFRVLFGIFLLIRADFSNSSKIFPTLGKKLVFEGDVTLTSKTVIEFLKTKYKGNTFEHMIPGEDLLRRFIASFYISPKALEILNGNFQRCVKSGSRRMAGDEKVAGFTGNSADLLNAGKPEGIGTWISDCAMETRFNEPFVVDLHPYHKKEKADSKSKYEEKGSLLDYQERWFNIQDSIGSNVTVNVADSFYSSKKMVHSAIERDPPHKFIWGVNSKRFAELVEALKNDANDDGEWAGIYNKKLNLLVFKRTSFADGLGTKISISNYLIHRRGNLRDGEMNVWDAFNTTFPLPDHFHMHIEKSKKRRSPFRHGSNGHYGVRAHLTDIYVCFLVENIRVVHHAVQEPMADSADIPSLELSLAFYKIEQGLHIEN